jgi:hypothetical protein
VKRFVHIIFEVAGSTALMITVVDFTLLSAEFKFWNLVAHFFTSISFLIELSLNAMGVRLHDLSYCSVWSISYLAIIWPIVAFGVRDWPYGFLKVDSWSCILWYNALFVGNLLFFLLFYKLGAIKERLFFGDMANGGSSASNPEDKYDVFGTSTRGSDLLKNPLLFK